MEGGTDRQIDKQTNIQTAKQKFRERDMGVGVKGCLYMTNDEIIFTTLSI